MKRKFYKLNDRGVALIAGLLILVVLSILGITTMQSSLLQERMAGNFEQRDIAFQAAEAGLRAAETQLDGVAVLNPDDIDWLYSPANQSLWKDPNVKVWEGTSSEEVNNVNARYYVELVVEVEGVASDSLKFGSVETGLPSMYRVTSRGVSPNGRSQVILQSTFLR